MAEDRPAHPVTVNGETTMIQPGYAACSVCGDAKEIPGQMDFVREIRRQAGIPTLTAEQCFQWVQEAGDRLNGIAAHHVPAPLPKPGQQALPGVLHG